VGFFSAAGERSGPATFEGDLRLAAPAPAGFLQIVGDYFPVFHALRVPAITVYRRRTSRRLLQCPQSVELYSAARPAEPIYSEDQRRNDERLNGIIVSGGGLL